MKRQDDWRLDITGPCTAVLTNVMGRRHVIRISRMHQDKPWVWLIRWFKRLYLAVIDAVAWIVPAVICLTAAWMAGMLVIMWFLGEL